MAMNLNEALVIQTGNGALVSVDQVNSAPVRPGPAQMRTSRVKVSQNAATSATPGTLVLGSLRHPQLRLRSSLPLRVEREHDFVTVWNDALEELGYGPYLTVAVEDFQKTVVELYFSLRSDQSRLGPEMARLWQKLQERIEERR